MSKLKKNEKKTLLHKLLEFKLAGTVSYAKYLAAQLESSEGVAIRKAYTRYIKKEITSTAKKIARLESKLKKSKPKEVKPVKAEKTVVVAKPIVAKPAVARKPVTAAKPTTVAKPRTTAKPAIPAKAAVAVKPKPAAKPAATKASGVAKPVVSVKAKPAVKSAPSKEEKPK